MTRYVQAGSIKRHFEDVHNIKSTKYKLLDNTTILTQFNSRQKLYIKEALLIIQSNPKINKQYDNFNNILKLYKSRNPNSLNNHLNSSQISLTPPSTNLNNNGLLTSHEISPQITHRIEQLLSNVQDNPSSSEQPTPTAEHTPLSRRLRSSRRLID